MRSYSFLFTGILVVAVGSGCSSLPNGDGFQSLFDGENLDGWVKRGGKATYRVEDGAIVGTTAPNTPNTFLCTERDFADFELRLEFKVDSRMNSGVQFRSVYAESPLVYSHGGKETKVSAKTVHGYQYEIDPIQYDGL